MLILHLNRRTVQALTMRSFPALSVHVRLLPYSALPQSKIMKFYRRGWEGVAVYKGLHQRGNDLISHEAELCSFRDCYD